MLFWGIRAQSRTDFISAVLLCSAQLGSRQAHHVLLTKMAASPVRPASAPRSLQEGGIMRIPLHKRQHAVAAEKRLAHERERVRRRAQELPAATSNDSADHLVQGALAFSEAPLGVGYGCEQLEFRGLEAFGVILWW